MIPLHLSQLRRKRSEAEIGKLAAAPLVSSSGLQEFRSQIRNNRKHGVEKNLHARPQRHTHTRPEAQLETDTQGLQ